MNNSLHEISNLLNQTTAITRRYKDVEKATGSGFNILRLLHMGHYEAKTHTPILADLLDPCGSHNQGEVFLELFLETCIRNNDPGFMKNGRLVNVHEEKHIGAVDYEKAAGGRIDIHLASSTGEILVIENKIYANEGHQQIDRYLNYIKGNAGGSGKVVFLTLSGEEPTTTEGTTPDNLLCLSYRSDIKKWLQLCQKEVATIPIIRESLSIYIDLICHLTNQNPNQKMNNEITELALSTPEATAATLALAEINIQDAIFEKVSARMEILANKLGLKYERGPGAPSAKYFGFDFKRPNWKGFSIGFNFDTKGCQDLVFGFYDGGALDKGGRIRLQKMFENEFGGNSSSSEAHWAANHWWNDYRNWKDQTLLKILHGKFLDDLREKLSLMRGIGDKFTESLS